MSSFSRSSCIFSLSKLLRREEVSELFESFELRVDAAEALDPFLWPARVSSFRRLSFPEELGCGVI